MSSEFDRDVESSFSEVGVNHIYTPRGQFSIISLHELPVHFMMKMHLMAEPDKMPAMLKLVENCLINPEDWERFQELSTKDVLRFLNQWMMEGQRMENNDN